MWKPAWKRLKATHPAKIYLFRVNNINNRKRCKICSKLTLKTQERHHWRRSGVFVNFKHISHLSSVFVVDFEQLNVNMALSKWSSWLETKIKFHPLRPHVSNIETLVQINWLVSIWCEIWSSVEVLLIEMELLLLCLNSVSVYFLLKKFYYNSIACKI